MTERTDAQRYYDAYGHYQRQDNEPRLDSTYVAWSADMTNSRRHCWNGKDPVTGEPRRWLDHQSAQYIEAQKQHRYDDYDAPEDWKVCTVDHSINPKAVGEIEWMRFIHEWGRIAPEGQRYFTEDGQLWITPTGLPTSDGQLLYAEAYFNVPPPKDDLNAQKSFTFRLKVALFLSNGQAYARIEVYDPELAGLAQQVWDNVQASYKEATPA